MSDEEREFRRVLAERDNARHELDRQVNLRVTAERELKDVKAKLHAAESGNKELQHEVKMLTIGLESALELVKKFDPAAMAPAEDLDVDEATIEDLES